MAELKHIPLPTFCNYFADKDGNIYRELEKIGQWKHYPPRRMGGGPYMRCRLKMKNGGYKLFFVQRLMAMAFYGLKNGQIVRHGDKGCRNNELSNLSVGTHLENQTEDRLKSGTYFSRGATPDPFLNELSARLNKEIGF